MTTVATLLRDRARSQPDATFLRFAATDTEVRALDGERRRAAIELRDGYQAVWREVVQAGCDAGRFDVADVQLTAIGLLELCTGVSHWYTPGGGA